MFKLNKKLPTIHIKFDPTRDGSSIVNVQGEKGMLLAAVTFLFMQSPSLFELIREAVFLYDLHKDDDNPVFQKMKKQIEVLAQDGDLNDSSSQLEKLKEMIQNRNTKKEDLN